MSVVLKLVETAAGEPTEFDGKYVVFYDPTYMPSDGRYDGGELIVTADIWRAQKFETIAEALALWKQPFGLRPDGQPNRPLTAWSVMCETV